MEIITSLEHFNIDNCRTGVALGNFDGVHIGHQTLIVNLVEICKNKNLKSVIYTFKNHPRKLTTENGAPQKIISDKQKFKILSEMGIDYLIFIDFDEYQRTLPPEKFIEKILAEKLKMAYAVVGFDYRFGYQAKGDITLLDELKDIFSYQTTVIEPIKIQRETISSTGIRELIKTSNINKANLFLGRQYSIIGQVIQGRGLGKKFGFPTANIRTQQDIIIPGPGVYFTKCVIDSKTYCSITNIGANPTLGSDNPISIETSIFNFNEDIYGKEMEILFYQRHRGEMKFLNIDGLIKQVQSDIEQAKKFFGV